ncbi:uncharacterized protein LOC128246073 [Mya arenaria]|uniref:uncharacterized protein LOC128246073 n=1 Tax=Mya arenaria TaxID=6604 RepID=UPI0022DFDF0D|nr:uncharacterized protein LOC128246073 [Mya arenaria]
MREYNHKNVIPAMYLVIGTIFLLASASKYGFAKAQQPPPTQTQLQAIYVLQHLLKTNPEVGVQLEMLLQTAENTSAITAEQAGISPMVDMAINAIGDMLKPNNDTAQIDQTNYTPGAVAAGGLNAVNLLSQSALLQEVLKLVSDQIQEGQIKAAKNNITIGNNMASLFGLVSPLQLLKDLAGNHPARQILQNSPQGSVNEECFNDLTDMLDSAVAGKMWALSMIDADGKPAAGIFRGHFYFVGSYDECYLVEPIIKAGDVIGGQKRTSSSSFDTRFCRVDIAIPEDFIDSLHVDTHGIHLKVTMGLCVPDSCHSSDVKGLFSLDQVKQLNLEIENSYCYEDTDLGTDESAIVAICVLSFFAFLIVFGTICDIAKRGRVSKKQIPKQEESISESRYTSIIDVNNQHPQTTSVEIISSEKQASDFPPAYMPHKENYKGAITEFNGDIPAMSNGAAHAQNNGVKKGNVTSSHLKEDIKNQDSLIERIFMCFSVYTNAPKLLSAHTGSGAITCVHGIRFLSLTWVILGHTYNYGILSQDETFTADNLLDFVPIYQRFTFQAVIGGGFAVDTFFVLSAFLVTWLQLKDIAKRTKKCSIGHFIMYYFHRFWRLTPIYMLVLMAFGCLYQYLGSGPFWPSKIWAAEHCKTNWWTNLLYVNNLVGTDAQCMGWSWYLAVDMQFYVITPIFLALMYWNVVAGIGASVALLATGIGITYWKEHEVNGNFFTMLSDGGDYWKNVYTVPWCRVGCWAIGMLLGLIIYKRGNKPLKSKLVVFGGWLMATATGLAIIYSPHSENKDGGEEWSPVQRGLYESVARPAWGICVAWVIFACHTGCGGFVNSVLSWSGIVPLSRLTYAAYLVHPICMMVYFFSRRVMFHVNDYNVVYLFFGHFCITYMVSFVVSLAFEAPAMALEKLLFRGGKRH